MIFFSFLLIIINFCPYIRGCLSVKNTQSVWLISSSRFTRALIMKTYLHDKWVVNCRHYFMFNGRNFKKKKKKRKSVINAAFRCPWLRSCLEVEVAVPGSPSLISLMVSVDVKQHWPRTPWLLVSWLWSDWGVPWQYWGMVCLFSPNPFSTLPFPHSLFCLLGKLITSASEGLFRRANCMRVGTDFVGFCPHDLFSFTGCLLVQHPCHSVFLC